MPTDDPASPPPGVLAYKLALAILSTLQDKGLVNDAEVERILLAAKLSARASTPAPAAVPLLDLDLGGDQG